MLPGLRFLFAASLICASLLVFGMGAIALMRASHQQFASAPPGPPSEPVFAQVPQTVPSLSMMRVEPRVDAAPDEKVHEKVQETLKDEDRLDIPAPTDPAPRDVSNALPEPVAAPRHNAGETPSVSEVMTLAKELALAAEAPSDKTAGTTAPETAPAPPPVQAIAEPQPEPAATGSIAMPEDQPVTIETLADPPLPQARPEIAVLSRKAELAPAKAKPKPIVKRKIRQVRHIRPKAEKLPAVSSAPTLGSLFSSGNN